MLHRYVLTLTDAILSFVELLLTLRIILKLLGARTAAPFVTWVYETTKPLLSPFEGMFPSSTLAGGFVIEVSALFALLVYAFLGFLLQSIIVRLTTPTTLSADADQDEVIMTRKKRR